MLNAKKTKRLRRPGDLPGGGGHPGDLPGGGGPSGDSPGGGGTLRRNTDGGGGVDLPALELFGAANGELSGLLSRTRFDSHFPAFYVWQRLRGLSKGGACF